jgi:pyruvate dehydrogenase E2 component (dihydrolipoamide acetyltransferase)
MTPRTLCYLALLSTAACGSGRLAPAPAESPEPASPGPVAAPAPAAEPTTAPPAAAAAPAPYAPYDASGTIPIRRIGQWTASGIDTPQRKVIRDDSTFAQFWQSLGAGQRPVVDFTRDVVIAVAAGQRQTGGYAIAVQRVARAGKSMTVDVVETAPGPGCWTPQQITQPVDVVVVAAADAPTFSFSDQVRSQGCK